jgi:hypothetical protein
MSWSAHNNKRDNGELCTCVVHKTPAVRRKIVCYLRVVSMLRSKASKQAIQSNKQALKCNNGVSTNDSRETMQRLEVHGSKSSGEGVVSTKTKHVEENGKAQTYVCAIVLMHTYVGKAEHS